MILVDTSVLIDFLRNRKNPKVETLHRLYENDIPFCISVLTFQEILQGARDDLEYARLRKYLLTQVVIRHPDGCESYERAARLYYDLRRSGVTIRSAFDLLIAITAAAYGFPLLHNDRDFDAIAAYLPSLHILNADALA